MKRLFGKKRLELLKQIAQSLDEEKANKRKGKKNVD